VTCHFDTESNVLRPSPQPLPVMRPTSPNSSRSSRNFWFESAFSGDVYTATKGRDTRPHFSPQH